MSVDGNWRLTMETPFGVQTPLLAIEKDGNAYSGTLTGSQGTTDVEQLNVAGSELSFSANVPTPMGTIPISFSGKVEGDAMKGFYETMMGKTEFSGVRE